MSEIKESTQTTAIRSDAPVENLIESTPSHSRPAGPARLRSIDAYRGFVMLLMLAEVLRFCDVSTALPNSAFWKFLCRQQTHAAWVGCSLHDLIQPSFSFLVGVAVPFSIASRRARGQTFAQLIRHAFTRSILLIFLGIALLAVHPRQIDWIFVDTLTQIGLAYPFVFLLAFSPRSYWWSAFVLILVAYWFFFALYPLPPADFDFSKVGISAEWLQNHGLHGFAAHWQKNSNPAAEFDRWFLNLFPRETRFIGAANGLTTLNFIPLIGTMILGMAAGQLLKSARAPWQKVRWLLLAGTIGVGLGLLLGFLGICPVVKAIWTPSWVLFSGGLCLALTAAWFVLIEILEFRKLVLPLVVVGMNSILAYAISHVFPAFAFNLWRRIFGAEIFRLFGPPLEPIVYGAVVLAGYWLILFSLYRAKIFLKI
jgi:heparan-alpha-glucosaminide N-acetyltransferase